MSYKFQSEQTKKSHRKGAIKSGELSTERHKKLVEEYNQHPKQCTNCQKNLPYEKRVNMFCSHSCGATYNNKRRSQPQGKCKNCGNQLKQTQTIYCSRHCSGQYKRKQVFNSIENGTWKSNRGYNKSLYNYLIKYRGYHCEICQNESWMNTPIKLTVHHIDGNFTNNKLDNLQLLCWNCHAMTDNFGAKNENSTRKYRYNN